VSAPLTANAREAPVRKGWFRAGSDDARRALACGVDRAAKDIVIAATIDLAA